MTSQNEIRYVPSIEGLVIRPVTGEIQKKSSADRTTAEYTNLLRTLESRFAEKTDIGHRHDDIYYTKNESDTLLEKKTDNTVIASEFDESSLYSIGDYTMFSGKDYRFISEHNGGPFDATKVEEVNVSNEIKNVKILTNSKVSKNGDTLPGRITFKINELEDGTAVSSETWGNTPIVFKDKNDEIIGAIHPIYLPSGKQGVSIRSRRWNSNKSSKLDHALTLFTEANGTKSVILSDPDAWRSAIGIKSKTVAGTTQANGGISLGIAISNTIPLALRISPSSNQSQWIGYYFVTRYADAQWTAVLLSSFNTYSILANTNVNGILYYLEI